MSQNQEKPGKRIWLIAGVAALLLIGGGIAVSAFLSSQSNNAPAEQNQDDDDKDDKKDSEKDDKDKEDKD
ncbi:hypothetical protein QT971_28180 [Microcoleus sp. herbarium19]|uniref:hypothetical protein n=1 Tax=unclassified Microcoleus TaxID=2642155 RepID=UPI002FD66448